MDSSSQTVILNRAPRYVIWLIWGLSDIVNNLIGIIIWGNMTNSHLNKALQSHLLSLQEEVTRFRTSQCARVKNPVSKKITQRRLLVETVTANDKNTMYFSGIPSVSATGIIQCCHDSDRQSYVLTGTGGDPAQETARRQASGIINVWGKRNDVNAYQTGSGR